MTTSAAAMPKTAFGWYELMTTDVAAATAFYTTVVGWSAQDSGMPGTPYTLLAAGAAPLAGVTELSRAARDGGIGPSWIGYVMVGDVDGYAGRVQQGGGSILHAPADIPGVGRIAVAADPQGTPFVLFKGVGTAPPTAARGTPGYIDWRELFANDWPSAFDFYSRLFGWEKADAVPMGADGVYQLFSAGGEPIGGMMTRRNDAPGPMWLYYFNVDAIDGAVDRVKSNGGEVLIGPHEVPGGDWIVQCRDPQGAMFALFSGTR